MKYFIDFEFLEGDVPVKIFGLNVPKWLIKPNNTIQPISVGICSSDGREYYAISKDFNLKEAWNRYDIKTMTNLKGDSDTNKMKVYWLRDNVLKPIYNELVLHHTSADWYHKNPHLGEKVNDGRWLEFNYKSLKWLINKYGKTNKQIAKEIKHFVANRPINSNKEQWILDYDTKDVQFYGYYSDYDWVVFCWLFGKMIDLPKGFPMYCIDLKQELDNKANNLNWLYLRDTWNNSRMSIYTIGKGDSQKKDRLATLEEKLKRIKELDEYPKQTNEHNALADARWNKKLYTFLKDL